MSKTTAAARRTPTAGQIDAFIDDLTKCRAEADAFNQYAHGSADNAIRRNNLRLYLQCMASRSPRAMLVMEAPGYRGCRLTGIPVTSRKMLLEGVRALNIFGTETGFRDVSDIGFESIYGEQSATIVWTALAEMGALPLIWNAYPLHPHKPGEARSNRKPRRSELKTGERFLRQSFALWSFDQVIAVGNVAHETLAGMGISCAKIRHPAQGGKRDFIAGLRSSLAV